MTSPHAYEELTSETVLVMEYVEGPHIDNRPVLEEMGVDPHEIGTIVTQNYIKQLLYDGLFHADPHQGNIIVKPGPAIEWIDLGMVGRLNDTERGLLRKMFLAVASRDAQEMKNVLLTWGRPVGEVNHSKLLQDLDSMLSRYASDGIADIDLTSALSDLLTLIRGQHIAMPASFTMLSRGIMTFEGTIEAIAPDISIIGAINDYLKSHALDEFDLTQEVEDALFSVRKLSRKAINIPSQISDLLTCWQRARCACRLPRATLNAPSPSWGPPSTA